MAWNVHLGLLGNMRTPRQVAESKVIDVSEKLIRQGEAPYESVRFQMMKRAFDIVVSSFLLLLLFPVFLAIAVMIGRRDGFPVFYTQQRLGQNGQIFGMFKFRSMRKDAEKVLEELLASDPEIRAEYEATYKLKNDPRILPGGGFLRRSSLDELPQLLNVLRGDMSLVGPRPIVPPEAKKYGDDIDVFLKMKPGCAGMWQSSGRSDTSYDERIQLDKDYYWNASCRNDIVVLWKTVVTVLTGKGAY